MKKVLSIAVMLFAGMFTYCYGQDVRVNINNQDISSNTSEFKINGISSSEDIGGVDVEFRTEVVGNSSVVLFVSFTNYNPFPVTVLSILSYEDRRYGGDIEEKEKTITAVLGANGTKTIQLNDYWRGSGGSVEGLIVRKLAQ